MKMFKRVISLLLVACLLMCTLPSAFAAESKVSTVAEEEEDILDNPVFTGAIADIVASFLKSFTEVFYRYVEIIKTLILSLDLPGLINPEVPEVPDSGDEGSTDTPEGDEQPSEGDFSGTGDAPEDADDNTEEELQPAA